MVCCRVVVVAVLLVWSPLTFGAGRFDVTSLLSRYRTNERQVSSQSPTTVCAALLDYQTIPGALKISHYAMNTERTEGNHLLTSSAARGLIELIKLEGGYRTIIDLLVRLGLDQVSAADPNYAELILSGENTPLNLLDKHRDPAVEAYIEHRFRKSVRAGEISPLLVPSGPEARARFFFDQVMESFSRLNDPGSRNALIVVFTEVDRQIRRYRDTRSIDRNLLRERLEGIFSHVQARAFYIPKPFGGVPDWASEISDIAVSGLNLVGAIGVRLYRKFVEGDLRERRRSLDPITASKRMEQVPGTLRLFIVGRDFYHLESKARHFFATYAGIPVSKDQELPTAPASDLLSYRFARSITKVFPEIEFTRQIPNSITSRFEREAFKGVRDGVFGKTSYEGLKILSRAAHFLAVLRGDASVFRNLSESDFRVFREQMLSDLKLTDPVTGELSFEPVNDFFTFMLEESVGRGESTLLKELDELHRIRERVGTDWARRGLRLLKAYPFASSSFARLSDSAQEQHLDAWQRLYYFNSAQVPLGEGSRNAYLQLQGASQETLARLYYLATLTDIPLDGDGFAFWNHLRPSFFSLQDPSIRSEEVYATSLRWMEGIVDPRAMGASTPPATLIQLARRTDSRSAEELRLLSETFARLRPTDRQRIERFLEDYPSLTYHARELFVRLSAGLHPDETESGMSYLTNLAAGYRALEETNTDPSPAVSPRKVALEIWLSLLARAYEQVESDEHFSNLLVEVREKYELRINLGPLLKGLKNHHPSDLARIPLRVEFHENAYEVSLP